MVEANEFNRKQRGLAEHTQQHETYGKGLLGKTKAALDRGDLQIVSGEYAGQKAKSGRLLSSLPSIPDTLKEDPVLYREFALAFPAAIGVLTSSRPYAEQVGGHDLHQLPAIAMDMARKTAVERSGERQDSAPRNTVVRTVFGATEEMPLRSFSYLLPAFDLAEACKRAELSIPQVQIIFATNISGRLNQLDLAQAHDQAQRFAKMGRAFAEMFYPDIADRVLFMEDTPLERETPLREAILETAQAIATHAPVEMQEALARKGGVNAARSNRISRFYGAGHPVMHDRDLPDSLQVLSGEEGIREGADNIISVGGYQEAFFYDLRHAIKPFLPSAYKDARTMQILTKHRVPPYYLATGGDIGLDAVLANQVSRETPVSPAAEFDLKFMTRALHHRGSFQEFLAMQRSTLQ